MDVLSGFQVRAAASLEDIARLLGLPGKMGISGADVWSRFNSGKIESIRDYCETDVLNTYLVYLRFEFIRGNLSEKALETEYDKVRSALVLDGRSHLLQFLSEWLKSGMDTS